MFLVSITPQNFVVLLIVIRLQRIKMYGVGLAYNYITFIPFREN
jgi:hypothetical protein